MYWNVLAVTCHSSVFWLRLAFLSLRIVFIKILIDKKRLGNVHFQGVFNFISSTSHNFHNNKG